MDILKTSPKQNELPAVSQQRQLQQQSMYLDAINASMAVSAGVDCILLKVISIQLRSLHSCAKGSVLQSNLLLQ